MTTKTITLTLPASFVDANCGKNETDWATILLLSHCGKCGTRINGNETGWNHESDHWDCQECPVKWCDECVNTTIGDVPDDGFVCMSCAGEDPSYQHCEMPDCSKWRFGDEHHWDCHDIGGVLCPDHNTKTREEKARCSESGCDACYDGLFPNLRELYSSVERQQEFIEAEGLDDEPGNHICWLALERALDGALTSDEQDELGGAMEHEHRDILTRLAVKNGLPVPDAE